MKFPRFQASGEYSAHVDGRILITSASGRWNIEKHQESQAQSQALVAQLESNGAWAVLVHVTDTLVTSLEVFEAGRRALQDRSQLPNLIALAWAIKPEVEGYQLLMPSYRDMYKGIIQTACFQDETAALEWLRACLETHLRAHLPQ